MKSTTSLGKHKWKLGLKQSLPNLALSNSCQDVGEEHLEDALAPWLLDYTFSIPMRRFSWAEASEAEFDCLRPILEMRVLFQYDGTF